MGSEKEDHSKHKDFQKRKIANRSVTELDNNGAVANSQPSSPPQTEDNPQEYQKVTFDSTDGSTQTASGNDVVALVIGKQGQVLQCLQGISEAELKVDETNNNMSVTMYGTDEQNDTAQKMINALITREDNLSYTQHVPPSAPSNQVPNGQAPNQPYCSMSVTSAPVACSYGPQAPQPEYGPHQGYALPQGYSQYGYGGGPNYSSMLPPHSYPDPTTYAHPAATTTIANPPASIGQLETRPSARQPAYGPHQGYAVPQVYAQAGYGGGPIYPPIPLPSPYSYADPTAYAQAQPAAPIGFTNPPVLYGQSETGPPILQPAYGLDHGYAAPQVYSESGYGGGGPNYSSIPPLLSYAAPTSYAQPAAPTEFTNPPALYTQSETRSSISQPAYGQHQGCRAAGGHTQSRPVSTVIQPPRPPAIQPPQPIHSSASGSNAANASSRVGPRINWIAEEKGLGKISRIYGDWPDTFPPK